MKDRQSEPQQYISPVKTQPAMLALDQIVSPHEVAQIVESVFVAMVSLDVCECDVSWASGENRLTAAVHFAGGWSGALLIECSHDQACCFAGRFLSVRSSSQVDDTVRDVLGELASMIAGNLKCTLIRETRLSMPSVVDGCDYSLRFCGVETKRCVAFQCTEGVFWVTVLAGRPSRKHSP